MNLDQLKPIIRATILTLGREANETEISDYFLETQGESLKKIIRALNYKSFSEFFRAIPDVCRIVRTDEYGRNVLARVSEELTAHMDELTINKFKVHKNGIGGRGRIRFRSQSIGLYRPPMRAKPYDRVLNGERRNVRRRSISESPPRYQRYYDRDNPLLRRSRSPSRARERSRSRSKERERSRVRRSRLSIDLSPLRKQLLSGRKKDEKRAKDDKVPKKKSVYPPLPPPLAVEKVPEPPEPETGVQSDETEDMPNYAASGSVSNIPLPPLIASRPQMPLPPENPQLGREKVVYNQNKRVIYDGNEERVQQLRTEGWKSISSEKEPTPNNVPFTSVSSPLTPSSPEPQAIVKHTRTISISSDEEDDSKSKENPTKVQKEKKFVPYKGGNIYGDRKPLIVHKVPDFIMQYFITSSSMQISYPTLTDEPRFFEIKIKSVESPSKFTFQYDFGNSNVILESMKTFYDGFARTDDFFAKELEINMIVAAKHGKNWFRAQIKSFDDSTATIDPIDCMMVESKEVSRNKIFYLHMLFFEQPRKSAVGKIFGIQPKDEKWSVEATKMIEEIIDVPRKATVHMVSNSVYHLSIIYENQTVTKVKEKLLMMDLARADPRENLSGAANICQSFEEN